MWSANGQKHGTKSASRTPPPATSKGRFQARSKVLAGALLGVILVATAAVYATRPSDAVIAEQDELFEELQGFQLELKDAEAKSSLSQLAPGDEPELHRPASGAAGEVRTADYRTEHDSVVWLTGTIEEVDEPAELPRFPQADYERAAVPRY